MPVDLKRLYATDDAVVWAATFMDEFGHRTHDIDAGLMIAWFANAMETAKATVRSHRERPADGEVVVLPRGALYRFFGEMALPPWRDEHGREIGGGIDCAPIASRCIEWVEANDLSGCVDA